jgi:aminoglycoside phosphotransferase (APT) family kinase protein
MDFPKALTAELAKIIGIESTALQISLRKPLDFQSNRLYDIRGDHLHFIAKEYLKPDEFASAPLREYKSLQLLSGLDVAPRAVLFNPDIAPIVVYEYMDGEMWDRRPASPADLSKLAQVWLKIARVPADWLSRGSERSAQDIEQEIRQYFNRYAAWSVSKFEPGKQAIDMCLQVLDDRQEAVKELSDHTPRLCFCRSDPRFANVIQRPDGKLGLVDWEDSGLRDPAREAADILTHPNQEDLIGWQEWQVFLGPYIDARTKHDKGISRRLHLYLAIYPLFWLAILMNRGVRLASTGQVTNWAINDLSANIRLRRYLARACAWPAMNYEPVLEKLRHLEFFPDRDARKCLETY